MKTTLEPVSIVSGWRLLNLGFFMFAWTTESSEPAVFVLLLLLVLFACIRTRFRVPVWSVAVDAAVCMAFAPYTALGHYGLALPIFELALRGRWPYALLFFASLFAAAPSPGWLFWYFVLALFMGLFCHAALSWERRYKQEADEQRKARHELERTRIELLEASRLAAQQAELMERYRIARQLHDHLGHDLTGAALALEAYEYVEDPDEAKRLLQEVKRRLSLSTRSLRETVHNATPEARIGVEHLEDAASRYRYADVRFDKSGNLPQVPAHYWALLEACLKEGLTNVARHSNAKRVDVKVQASESIVRLLVQDDGTAGHQGQPGSGLRSLQMRARALGGSLTASSGDGFKLVCVLPLAGGGGHDATDDR